MVDPALAPVFRAVASVLHVDADGRISFAAQVAPETGDYVFRLTGEIWEIRFDDERALLRDRVGLGYIYQLLRSPGEDIPSLLLAAGPEGFARLKVERRQAVVDDQAVRALVSSARRGTTEASRELAPVIGLDSRSRPFSTSASKARVSVKQAIRDAIGLIDRHCPELARHLNSSLITGNFCVYRPIAPLEWEL